MVCEPQGIKLRDVRRRSRVRIRRRAGVEAVEDVLRALGQIARCRKSRPGPEWKRPPPIRLGLPMSRRILARHRRKPARREQKRREECVGTSVLTEAQAAALGALLAARVDRLGSIGSSLMNSITNLAICNQRCSAAPRDRRGIRLCHIFRGYEYFLLTLALARSFTLMHRNSQPELVDSVRSSCLGSVPIASVTA